ncbi:hypothetical protein VMT65_22475 [Nocardia sp. CDC153]|uniref:hypothetical protein n=1 Tax=Nocardia sp. CDC153 TaxID=3112167 RepID=UPI002DB93A2A|nr:hypothetical protein [Nocardia sp. CDC153]MEC3955816.1 hypothetical protein [Nocardia sp. CDC153]
MDRELAEYWLDIEESTEEPEVEEPPTPEGYTLDTYLLLSIIDGLQGVQAAVIAAAGADPPQVKPMPRPQTALDVVREERRLATMNSIIDIFKPAAG